MPHVLRKIPLRTLNREASLASVIDNCATWKCVCGRRDALQGHSGAISGPTAESVTHCPSCRRMYFVIPYARSFGAPVEVVELMGPPDTTPAVVVEQNA